MEKIYLFNCEFCSKGFDKILFFQQHKKRPCKRPTLVINVQTVPNIMDVPNVMDVPNIMDSRKRSRSSAQPHEDQNIEREADETGVVTQDDKCSKCNKNGFASVSNLRRHEKNCQGPKKPRQCDICLRQFATRQAKNQHKIVKCKYL